jgi:hypothetical protein
MGGRHPLEFAARRFWKLETREIKEAKEVEEAEDVEEKPSSFGRRKEGGSPAAANSKPQDADSFPVKTTGTHKTRKAAALHLSPKTPLILSRLEKFKSLVKRVLRRFLFPSASRLESRDCGDIEPASPPILLRVEKIKSLMKGELRRFLFPRVLRVEFWSSFAHHGLWRILQRKGLDCLLSIIPHYTMVVKSALAWTFRKSFGKWWFEPL